MDKKYIALIILFIISILIRFLFVADCLYHHDSIQLARAIDQTVNTGKIMPAVGGKYVMVLLYSIPNYFIRNGELVATYMTIFFAGLSVCMLYLLVNKLFENKRIAFYSALLLAFSPLYLSITTYAKSHSLAIFFLLYSQYLFIQVIKNNHNKIVMIIPGLIYTLSLFTRVDNIIYTPLFILLAIIYTNDLRAIIKNVFWFVVPIFIIGLFGLYFGWLFKISSDKLISFSMVPKHFMYGIFNTVLGFGIISTVALIIILVAFLLIIKHDKRDLYLIFWGGLIIVYYLINVTAPRMYMISIIPLYIILARQIHITFNKWRIIWKIIPQLLILIILISNFIQIAPVISFRHHYCTSKELGIFFFYEIEDKENSLIITADEAPAIQYYGHIKTIPPSMINNTNKTLYITSPIMDFYNLSFETIPIGTLLWEDYHKNELYLNVKNITIYKVIDII